MTWVVVLLLALAAFAVIAFVLKAPRPAWEAVGAALLLGITGYSLQGSPGTPAAPKTHTATQLGDPAELVAERQALDGGPNLRNRWVVIGDALARNGEQAEAAGVLLGAVQHDPRDSDAWVALGNALVAHAEGTLSPAALHAYREAAAAAPDAPAAPYFLGLALAQSGRFGEARGLWAGVLAKAPSNARWRNSIAERLARLDALIAMQQRAAGVAVPPRDGAP
ncbi:MAG: cytochrome C biosynthesis protein [Novosphingobium sp.]|nr:cytochrome C biosynthesis protein [Novosphingobium sp.]